MLNWYPKIQAMKSHGVWGGDDDGAPNQALLMSRHVAFLDLDRLYFDLERFKAERGWHNLNLTRPGIAELLADTTWYRLLIPDSELAFDSFEKVRVWQEVALALLRKYVERYYSFRKREWELPHLEYREVGEDDPNFPCVVHDTGPEYGYRILIEKSQQEIVEKLNELKAAINLRYSRSLGFRNGFVISTSMAGSMSRRGGPPLRLDAPPPFPREPVETRRGGAARGCTGSADPANRPDPLDPPDQC